MNRRKAQEVLYLAIGRRIRRLQPLLTPTPTPLRIRIQTRRQRTQEETTSTGVIRAQPLLHKAVLTAVVMAIREVATVDQLGMALIVTELAQNPKDKEVMAVWGVILPTTVVVTNYSAVPLKDIKNAHRTSPADNNMDRVEVTGRVNQGRTDKISLGHMALQAGHLGLLVDTAPMRIERS